MIWKQILALCTFENEVEHCIACWRFCIRPVKETPRTEQMNTMTKMNKIIILDQTRDSNALDV